MVDKVPTVFLDFFFSDSAYGAYAVPMVAIEYAYGKGGFTYVGVCGL